MSGTSHERSIVVWDLPATVVCGRSFSVRLAIKCERLCRPDGWSLELRDHEDRCVAQLPVGDASLPGTEALHGGDIVLTAPAAEGLYRYRIVAPADAGTEPRHAAATAEFSLRVVPEAECRLTVIAIERESRAPVGGAKVVAHPYRAVTDAEGVAALELPRGQYRVFVSGRHHFPLRIDGELTTDTTIRAELELEPGPSDAELWA